MEIYRVTFFGHREITDDRAIEQVLLPLLRDLIREKEYVEFYVGRNGEFDELCARLVCVAKGELEAENATLILALPYTVKDIPFYETYYDEITIPDACVGAHPKRAITLRNRALAEGADLVISYVHHAGGAMTAVKYAETLKKRVFSITAALDPCRNP